VKLLKAFAVERPCRITKPSYTASRSVTPPARAGQDDVIPPPSTVTVWDDRVVLLWTHDERPIVRRTGF
jgi:hypothetical protein